MDFNWELINVPYKLLQNFWHINSECKSKLIESEISSSFWRRTECALRQLLTIDSKFESIAIAANRWYISSFRAHFTFSKETNNLISWPDFFMLIDHWFVLTTRNYYTPLASISHRISITRVIWNNRKETLYSNVSTFLLLGEFRRATFYCISFSVVYTEISLENLRFYENLLKMQSSCSKHPLHDETKQIVKQTILFIMKLK